MANRNVFKNKQLVLIMNVILFYKNVSSHLHIEQTTLCLAALRSNLVPRVPNENTAAVDIAHVWVTQPIELLEMFCT